MDKRNLGFLLIGLGTGLILSAGLFLEMTVMLHHMFIVGVNWHPASMLLAVPFVLILVGCAMLRPGRPN